MKRSFNVISSLLIVLILTFCSFGDISLGPNFYALISNEQTCVVVAGAVTIDWNKGRTAFITLGNGANTVTLTNPRSGGRYVLFLKQPPSGAAGTVTFSPVPWAASGALPTLTVTNGALDVITLVWKKTASKYVLGYTLDVK